MKCFYCELELCDGVKVCGKCDAQFQEQKNEALANVEALELQLKTTEAEWQHEIDKVKRLEGEKEISGCCFGMIAEGLEKVGCCHGHDIESTPPMSYDDMIYCAVAKREKQIKLLQAELESFKAAKCPHGEVSGCSGLFKRQKQIEQLQAENKQKTEALEKYGSHEIGCMHKFKVDGWTGCDCTCGFKQALKPTGCHTCKSGHDCNFPEHKTGGPCSGHVNLSKQKSTLRPCTSIHTCVGQLDGLCTITNSEYYRKPCPKSKKTKHESTFNPNHGCS